MRNIPAPGDAVVTPALAAYNVACGYGRETVLRGVSLSVAPGEMVALLGRNGCGKSTLLRLLSGVLPPRAGTVTLRGQPLASLQRREVARTLAVAPQDLRVPFAFAVREVVELGRVPYARFLHWPDEGDRRAVERALVVTDLVELAGRPFQQLSGGEQQRVALALALAQEPHILLLDEPTMHLDLAHQMSVLALLRALCATHGLSVLAAMHDINLTCLYFDRLLVLGEGTLLASGSPNAILSAELIEQAFGARAVVGRHPARDVPQISLLPGD